MRPWAVCAALVFCLAVLANGAALAEDDDGPLLVFAASSLAGVLEPALAGTREGARAKIAYAGSGPLARQIEAGAGADVFISANRQWVDFLTEAGLADAAGVRVVLANQLVIAAAPGIEVTGGPLTGAEIAGLLQGRLVAMGNPAYVPAGTYGKQALKWYGLWEDLRPQLVLTDSVRAVAALLAQGEVSFGLVYKTDARAAGLGIALVLDARSHPPVRYEAVPIRQGRTERAARLMAELTSAEAQAVFSTFGFPQIK